MRNNKAQALIEFVLILPVLIMIIFAVFDFGRIYVAKNKVENITSDAIRYIEADKDFDDIEEIIKKDNDIDELNITVEDESYLMIYISKKIAYITPGINLILGDNYEILSVRVIPYE